MEDRKYHSGHLWCAFSAGMWTAILAHVVVLILMGF